MAAAWYDGCGYLHENPPPDAAHAIGVVSPVDQSDGREGGREGRETVTAGQQLHAVCKLRMAAVHMHAAFELHVCTVCMRVTYPYHRHRPRMDSPRGKWVS